jgi:MoxR-like ATPase
LSKLLKETDLELQNLKEIDHRELENKVQNTNIPALEEMLVGGDSKDRPLQRIKKLKRQVNEKLVGREDEAAALFAASLAGVPAVLIGEPGTAKSLLIRMINDGCTQKKFFDYLMNSYTQPDELFGAPKIQEFMEGNFERDIEGKLPDAEFAFLDEIFRGGSHILNMLLSVINERKFHNGSDVIDLPLVNLYGAANAPPTDPDLSAFYDRFPIRVLTESVFKNRGSGDKDVIGKHLLATSVAIEAGKLDSISREQEKKDAPACSNDFRILRHYLLRKMEIDKFGGSGVTEKFRLAFYKLRDLPMKYSDRTFPRLLAVGVAHAFLETDICSNPKWEHLKKAFHWTADSHQQRVNIEYEIDGIESDMHVGSE